MAGTTPKKIMRKPPIRPKTTTSVPPDSAHPHRAVVGEASSNVKLHIDHPPPGGTTTTYYSVLVRGSSQRPFRGIQKLLPASNHRPPPPPLGSLGERNNNIHPTTTATKNQPHTMNVSSKLVVWMVVSLSPSSGAFNLPPPAYRNSPSSSSSIISSRSSSAVEVVASPPSRWSTRRPGTSLSSSASVAPCADGNNNNSNNSNNNSNSPAVVVASASSSTDGDADATTTATPTTTTTATLTKQQKRARQIRREGGMFAFDTKFGALNPFAIYYGLVSIALGLVWFAALTACDLLYRITGGRVDRNRRVPVFLSHAWGTLLMLLTGCFPKVENGNIVREFHKR